jgi:hypothetical protein
VALGPGVHVSIPQAGACFQGHQRHEQREAAERGALENPGISLERPQLAYTIVRSMIRRSSGR